MICSIKHGMITLELLWTRLRSRKPGSLRWSVTTKYTCSIKCLLLNAGKALLKARWVDIDKGTRYRSRWVAKQFKGSDSEEWFAATPLIEALRALISHTVSGPKKKALMVCDISRAFFYAPVQHEMYVSCVRRRRRQSKTTTCVQSYA